MSYRILVPKQLIAAVVSICLATQSAWVIPAHADQADDFIAKTHKLADGIATSTVNMMLLSALQQAVYMQNADPSVALKAMREQTIAMKSLGARLNKTYAIALDGAGQLSGQRLTQLYNDYVSIMSQITNQSLRLDGIRRDAHAFQAVIFNLAQGLMQSLEDRCREGYYVNPYSEIRPALQAIMPAYEVRLSFEFGGGQSPHMDPAKSGVSIAKTDEEKALWAVFYAGSVILSTYALTGTWVLTTQAFSSLALGTQMAALGMAFGVGLAVAAIIVAVQISQARDAAKKAVDQQRRMFEQRADHNTVNKLFTEKCEAAKKEFTDLRGALEAMARGETSIIQQLESNRTAMKAKIQTFVADLNAYVETRKRILGADFESKAKEEQTKLLNELDKSPEAKKFMTASQGLNPKDMAQMIMFIIKDLYHGGVTYSKKLEDAFQNTVSIINGKRSEERATLLRIMAGQKNMEEIQLKSSDDLQIEIRHSQELAEIYADLDAVILDLAEAVFLPETALRPKVESINERVAKLQERIQAAAERHPKSELLTFLKVKFQNVQSNIAIGRTL
ncbi:MAG: hypothetical protein AB7F86_01225 [Bdellovibrionales bacterium]